MQDTISRWVSGIAGHLNRVGVAVPMKAIGDRMSSQCLTSAGLLCTATSGHYVPKTGGSDTYALAAGTLVKVASGTDMPALVGTITATKFNVFCFFIDAAGTVTSQIGVEGAAIANIKFPQVPENKAMLGFIIVTYASTFTGGSTALDTATTVYVNTIGAVEPNILL